MSADNYYLIRKHPSGGYAAIHSFMSDDEEREAKVTHPRFSSLEDAIAYAQNDYTEYGVKVDPECLPDVTEEDQSHLKDRLRAEWEAETSTFRMQAEFSISNLEADLDEAHSVIDNVRARCQQLYERGGSVPSELHMVTGSILALLPDQETS